jgi:hypothetical protein
MTSQQNSFCFDCYGNRVSPVSGAAIYATRAANAAPGLTTSNDASELLTDIAGRDIQLHGIQSALSNCFSLAQTEISLSTQHTG